MERCPNCRARSDGSANCRRCGMELTLLLRTERAAEQRLREAGSALDAGHQDEALRALRQSLELKHAPLAEHLLEFLENRSSSRIPLPATTPNEL